MQSYELHQVKRQPKDRESPTFYLIISLVGSVILLGLTPFKALEPHQSEQNNDLKYSYIKMKGSATPETISELETIFELNRNNKKIQEMIQTVESYEDAIRFMWRCCGENVGKES